MKESPKPAAAAECAVSESERDLLAKLVLLEAGNESYNCKLGVMSVVINRKKNGYWGKTFTEVIYAKGQFTCANKITRTKYYNHPNWNDCYKAVDEVLKNGSVFPSEVMYFRTTSYPQNKNYIIYKTIGKTKFAYIKK